MGRKASREIAMKLLYQLEIQKEDKEEQVSTVLEENDLTDKDKEYVLDIVNGVQKNISYIDTTIEKYSKGWKITRIPKVDLSILRLAVFEISFREDIPFNVAINEAVELAKKYSGEEAGAFINGVLGKVSHVRLLPVEENKANESEQSSV